MDSVRELMLRAAREGIADASNDLDKLMRVMRETMPGGENPMPAEERIASFASALMSYSGRTQLVVSLAVALERLVLAEDFEKTVPRDEPA